MSGAVRGRDMSSCPALANHAAGRASALLLMPSKQGTPRGLRHTDYCLPGTPGEYSMNICCTVCSRSRRLAPRSTPGS